MMAPDRVRFPEWLDLPVPKKEIVNCILKRKQPDLLPSAPEGRTTPLRTSSVMGSVIVWSALLGLWARILVLLVIPGEPLTVDLDKLFAAVNAVCNAMFAVWRTTDSRDIARIFWIPT
jgi:hypothetical protein